MYAQFTANSSIVSFLRMMNYGVKGSKMEEKKLPEERPEGIEQLVHEIKAIHEMGLKVYSAMVNDVMNGQITEELKIERVMDGLISFGDTPEFVELYRKLCRFLYPHFPQLVGEHMSMFLKDFAPNSEEENE